MAKTGDQIGTYTLEKFLGSGGFGEVWLADNPQDLLYQKVAIKLAKSEDITLEMIKSEALLWRKVSGNENIIPFIEAKNYDGQVVIVSEFAEGGSLQDYLNKTGGKLEIRESESILRDILNGLEHLHNKGIGHFDLKPANILIKGGKYCLADFGLSKILVTENTSRGAGTLSYSPPELFNRKRTLQSDIWAVGVILQKMLTGKLPFEGDSEMSLMFSIIQNEPQPVPSEIPQLYRNLITKCLQKETKDRFQSAKEMLEVLKNSSQFAETEDSNPIIDKDSDKTKPSKIDPTQASPAIEVEKKRRRQLVESQGLVHSKYFDQKTPSMSSDQEMVSASTTENPSLQAPTKAIGAVKHVFPASEDKTARVDTVLAELSVLKPSPLIEIEDINRESKSWYKNIFVLAGLAGLLLVLGIVVWFSGSLFSKTTKPNTKTIRNSIDMELTYVPAGNFVKGSDSFDPNERPIQHTTINAAFWIGKYEVTQSQWEKVMGGNPSSFKNCGGDCPVETVSFDDANKFVQELNARNDGFEYSLPTQEEWEYAARAGSVGDYYGSSLNQIAWFDENSGGTTHSVGQKLPNDFGLYDMSGNVSEWCSDSRTSGDYNEVLRGGSWSSSATYVRSSVRIRVLLNFIDKTTGFRVLARSK